MGCCTQSQPNPASAACSCSFPSNDRLGHLGDKLDLDILIVDDTQLYREGLADILRREVCANAVRTAADLPGALSQMDASLPDVVLLNMATSQSVAVLRNIVAAVPHLPVISIGTLETDDQVIACAEAGASGFLFRGQSLACLVTVMQSVPRGESPVSPRTTATLLRRVATLAAECDPGDHGALLTPRERQIVRLIDEGLSNKEIAHRLSIEVRTVKNHVHNILDKLQVRRRGEAAARIRAAASPASALGPRVDAGTR